MSRERTNISDGWDYWPRRLSGRVIKQGGAPEGAERICLPHCWNARDTFADGQTYRQGWGTYRRRIELPQEHTLSRRHVRLRLDGFYGFGDIWVNGARVPPVDGAYLGLVLPLTPDLLKTASLDVVVRVCNQYRPDVLPGIKFPDFVLHGGLAGDAWLEGLPEDFVESDDLAIRTQAAETGVDVAVALACRTSDGSNNRMLLYEILDDQGAVVATREQALNPEDTTERIRTVIRAVPLKAWRLSEPTLYTLRVQLHCDGRHTDTVECRFGHRVCEFRPRAGFFLNGERVVLRGVNRHESMPGVGNALPHHVHEADAQQIKDMGLNFVRLSHYPQHPAFLDACDRLGIFVYAEVASWKSVRTGRWLRAAERQLSQMVRRDRNHPSVLLWGLGNEARSLPAYTRLREIATALDPGRLISYAENHLYRARRKKTLGFPDVWGLNYEFDALDEALDSCRTETVLVTECSNAPATRRGELRREQEQISQLAADLDRIAGRPEIAGFALWCFNDYATMRKDRYRRFSGVVDAWRLPKMSAQYLAARFAQRPVLYVHTDWSASEGKGPRDVYIVSNCSRLTLQCGDCSSQITDMPLQQTVQVPFTGDALVVEGDGEHGAASCRIEPHAPACGIRVSVSDCGLAPGGFRVYDILLTVIDRDERTVATWMDDVSVSMNGPGDLCTFSPSNTVMMGHGQGRVFARMPGTAQGNRLEASHPALTSAECVLGSDGE